MSVKITNPAGDSANAAIPPTSNHGKRYDDAFKRHIIGLVDGGQSASEIARQYDLATSSVTTWCKRYEKNGNFEEKPMLSAAEIENRELKKQLKNTQMLLDIAKEEIQILKKAVAVISK